MRTTLSTLLIVAALCLPGPAFSAAPEFSVDYLVLKGIVKTAKGYIAIVVNTQSNKTGTLKAGDALSNGRVVRIEAEKLVLCQDTDQDPKTACKEVIKKLHNDK